MKIKVIFLQDCKWGKRWEIKEVSPALFKNILEKQKLASKLWTPEANALLNKIKNKEKQLEKQTEKLNQIIKSLKENPLEIRRKVSPKWHLYNKVSEKDISEEIIKKFWFKIPKDKIKLNHIIDTPGIYPVKINYLWINENFKINVESL